jgi:hypothetical protein
VIPPRSPEPPPHRHATGERSTDLEREEHGGWDRRGCAWTLVRFGCGSAILWILMTLGIIGAALLSLMLFR